VAARVRREMKGVSRLPLGVPAERVLASHDACCTGGLNGVLCMSGAVLASIKGTEYYGCLDGFAAPVRLLLSSHLWYKSTSFLMIRCRSHALITPDPKQTGRIAVSITSSPFLLSAFPRLQLR